MGCGGSKKDRGADAGGGAGGGGAGGGAPEEAAASEVKAFLKNVPFFQRLHPDSLPQLASKMDKVMFGAGKEIIKQADEGDSFFVIKSGLCGVLIDGDVVAKLKGGDYFGEMALLRDQPRAATIKAEIPTECYTITRDKFIELDLADKLGFPKRGAVGGGAGGDMGEVEVKPPTAKNDELKALISSALKENKKLNSCVTLDDAKIGAMIEVMWEDPVAKGTKVISEGDNDAFYFYIVSEGQFEVSVQTEAQGLGEAETKSVGAIRKGGSFGELALLYHTPRAATITAIEDSKVMIIDRNNFKKIMADSENKAAEAYIQYFAQVEVLQSLNPAEKKQLALALTDMSFRKNEKILEEGETGDCFYILIEGEVAVVAGGRETARLKADGQSPQFFGERALLKEEKRNATIQVVSASAQVLVVDKQSFDLLLGPLEAIQKRGADGTEKVDKVKQEANKQRFGVIKRKDLKRLGLLGCGGFGAVELVEHTSTGEMYALKLLSKGYVIRSGMQSSVMSEKNVQLLCDSVFIVKLYETYNGDQSLYLLLELALGGELYATYNKKNLWGGEKHAKFYVAGTTFAFEHLHGKKIIFRDLKPENLLLNDQGQIKLTDMGLAKVVVGKTFTTCGTPDYFAPELIASKGHTHAVDWWTLGILLFELLSGHPPFESATPMQIYQKVTKGIGKVQFPKKCKPAEQLIKALCHTTPSERLPMKKGGSKNIKSHPYFSGFDWEAMFVQNMEPPYKPAVKSKKDMANFSARKEDMPPHIPYKDPKTGWDKDFATST